MTTTYNDRVGRGMSAAFDAIRAEYEREPVPAPADLEPGEVTTEADFGGDVIRALAEDIAPTYNPLREVPVELPYLEMGPIVEDAREVLVLDPASERLDTPNWRGALLELADDERPYPFTADEVGRILRGAVLLLANDAGDLGQCLSTATVWERG